jgi:hypothetical protein
VPDGNVERVDCKTLGIALTVARGAAELGGLALVVVGIVKDRAKARALFAVHKLRVGSARAYGRGGTVGVLSGGREPTTEERVKSAEANLAALERQIDDRFFDARKRTDAQIDEALEQAYAADKEIDDELRRGLADVLAGGIRGRVIGVALLFAGIVLSVAGNWVGALA